MVSYPEWTSVCYDVAKQKGANLNGPGTQDENQALVSVIADVWNERKTEIENSSRTEAKNIAATEIVVT